MKNGRTLSTTAIKFGDRYDPRDMRVFVQHVERVTSEMQRIMQLLSGGAPNQVLTKIKAEDYSGQWSDATGGVIQNSTFILKTPDPSLPNALIPVAGDNIEFDFSIPGQWIIRGLGGGTGDVESVQPGAAIDVDATDPANPVVGLTADALAALAQAETAVQPGDLAQVAYTGEYDDLVTKPPYYIIQNDPEVSYLASQLKRGRNIIGVRYAGPAVVRLPFDLPIEHIVSIKDEAGTGDVTISVY